MKRSEMVQKMVDFGEMWHQSDFGVQLHSEPWDQYKRRTMSALLAHMEKNGMLPPKRGKKIFEETFKEAEFRDIWITATWEKENESDKHGGLTMGYEKIKESPEKIVYADISGGNHAVEKMWAFMSRNKTTGFEGICSVNGYAMVCTEAKTIALLKNMVAEIKEADKDGKFDVMLVEFSSKKIVELY